MAEIRLNVNITEEKSLEDEFNEWKKTLRAEMISALPNVREDMKASLRKHLLTDVYDAFHNRVYERRKDNGGLGTSLLASVDNVIPIGDINDDASWAEVGFNYLPSGEHPQWPEGQETNRNELIRRIESGGPYYWRRKPGKREFWKNFVDEMVDDGELEDSFVRAMQMVGEEVISDGSLVRETGDGEY